MGEKVTDIKQRYYRVVRDAVGNALRLAEVEGEVNHLSDSHGYVPRPPNPAYVQFVNGEPWSWFTSDDILIAGPGGLDVVSKKE